MPKSYFDRAAISTMINKTIDSPWQSKGVLSPQFAGEDKKLVAWREMESFMSAPIYGQPSLVGYIFNQVGLGRTTLETETVPLVDKTDGTMLSYYILAEGGRIIALPSSNQNIGQRNIMQIGKHMIDWDHGRDTHRSGAVIRHAGTIIVCELGTIEAASEAFDEVSSSYEALMGTTEPLPDVHAG
jgi:hypothetical protein